MTAIETSAFADGDVGDRRSRRQREIGRMKAPTAQSGDGRVVFRKDASSRGPIISLRNC